jgi:hypothetical protein
VERRQAIVLAADEANVERALDDMAARAELHSIETLTLSDTQFLRGDAKPVRYRGCSQSAGTDRSAR